MIVISPLTVALLSAYQRTSPNDYHSVVSQLDG